MRPSRPRPAVALEPARVHAWRMSRQLLGDTRAASPVHVAKRLVGVQAQVLSAAALAVALRSVPPRVGVPIEGTVRALADRRLVRSWAMRGTLHLFGAEDVPIVAAAIAGRDSWRRAAWLRWFGATEVEMDRLIETIGEILDDGRPRTRAEMAEEVGARLGPNAGRLLLGSWGSAVRIASDRRFLVQSVEDGGVIRFVAASRWLRTWRREDPEGARRSLVLRFLAAYGPATATEIVRWWGGDNSPIIRRVIADLGDVLAEVEVGGQRALVRTQDIGHIRSTTPTTGSVRFLGGFDPLVVGSGLRAHLVPASHARRVSRTAGWISPVVLVDGVAAGVWEAARTSRGLTITVEPFSRPEPALRRAIAAAADVVGEASGTGVAVRFGRVFQATRRAAAFDDR